jgi:tungstate transport system ATP-binding protein
MDRNQLMGLSPRSSTSEVELSPRVLLRVEAVSYRVKEKSLIDQVTLSLSAGSRYLILGPNGAGKSLLLRLMHGLLKPGSGQITRPESSGGVEQAMVFQRPVLLRRSARDNIIFALQLARIEGDHRLLADDALGKVGLSELADRPARLCSIGEQQRIALARAWAVQPQLLFLDEPSASLDPSATRHVEAIINAMHAKGTTIVMASHDLGQARRLADHVLFMHQGRLIDDLPAHLFFNQARSPMARAFLDGDLLWETS